MKSYIRHRIDRVLQWRVDEVRAHADARCDQADAAIADLDRRLRDLEHRFGDIAHSYDRVHGDFMWSRGEIDRMMPQLAGLERRLEALRARSEQATQGVVDPEAEAQQLLAEARAEHERARLRLELAAHYEERLRRLEKQVSP